jgi:hypothetical protein
MLRTPKITLYLLNDSINFCVQNSKTLLKTTLYTVHPLVHYLIRVWIVTLSSKSYSFHN